MNLQTFLKKDYARCWVSDLFELSNEEGINYYITLKQAEFKLILKSVDGHQWSVCKKSIKT